jgi:hypothetical protein
MENINIINAPVEVQNAFAHVREAFPNVTVLMYNEDCQWAFINSDGTAPSFEGANIQLPILEAAADAQYNISVPVTYTA